MKKAIISLGLALGLWGLTASRAQAQIDPWHINTYKVTSAEGTFTDISTNPDAKALGSDLADGADLKNMTFSQAFAYDTTYKKGIDGEDSVRDGKKVIDKITVRVDYTKSTENVTSQTLDEDNVAGFPLGFAFNLFGKQMTHFVVSAYGGIYFRDKDRQGMYTTLPNSMPAKYAIWAHPYLRSAQADAATKLAVAGLVRKDGDNAPAYYLIEGTEGNHVLTVQHHYVVRGDNSDGNDKWDQWTFQFKCYEATGKIEFIVKELEYGNAFTHASKGKYHRILVSLTDYITLTPRSDDPYADVNMNITANGSNHRVFLAQNDDASAADGWDAFTLAGDISGDANTMRIDANGPEAGRTISFTQQTAPATVEPLTAEHYKKISETVTASRYTAKYVYNEKMLPNLSDFVEAGPIMAVISESKTPDYTLENGTLYLKDHEFAEVNGFKPKVIANMMPKISANRTANTYTYPSKNYEVEFNATDLKKQSVYYIHLYRMAYAGTNAPVYSPVCHTITFETAFSDPKTLEAGLADVDGVSLKVAPAEDLGVIVIKSNTPNVKPSGQLKKGDKIGDNAEVIELLTEEKTWKLPLEYGEGCFIVAISVIMDDENHYTYSPTKKYISVSTAYKGLPGVVDFTTLPFGVPNFEYNGINIRTQDFAKIEPTTYRDLPFGYTRTEKTADKDRAFGIGQPAYVNDAPHLVYAKTLVKGDVIETIDFITPPIVADYNRILMTFNTNWFTSNDAGEILDMAVGGEKDSRFYCSIEYAIGNGAWQKGADFYGYDLPGRENGYYPLSFSLSDENTSLIGQKIRFRFISQFADLTDQPTKGFVGIGSIDVKEDKLCQMVTHIVQNDSLTTTTQIGLSWNDPNQPAAPAYEIAYKPADDLSDTWRTKRPNSTLAVIENLDINTTYAVRITADCGGSFGKAYASSTAQLSTIHAFPYTDNLEQEESETVMVGGKPVSIAGKTPFDRGITTFIGTLPNEGYAKLNTASYGWSSSASSARVVDNDSRSTSVGVRETEPKGWLLMPAVYIKNFDAVYPQTIRFKANSAHRYANETVWTPGIGSQYTNAKLYVLLSHNGQFAKKDTVAVIEVSGKNIDHQAYEFDVPERLLKDGRAQVAFFFDNPNATDGGQSGSNDDAMLFEIYDFEYVYTDGVCIPTSNLVRTGTTPESASFKWDGYNRSYKIFWGPRNVGYTDSVALTGTTYTLTGLQEGTRYNVKVVGYCDEAGTELAPNALTTSFMTQEYCHMPEEFAVSGLTSTSVTFTSTNDQSILTQRLVYLTALEEDAVTRIILQTGDQVTVNGLIDKTVYTAQTRSVCGMDSSALSEPITFTTLADTLLIMLRVLPDDEYGTVTGQGRYEKNSEATITATPAEGYAFVAWVFGKDTVSTDAVYTFKVTSAGTFTAIFAEKGTEANEDAVRAAFTVSTKAGYLIIHNLKGLTVEEVTVYGVTGRQLGRFTPRSREDLSLPVAAERAVLVVRVASEQGVATYKVYLQ